jgi:hypothetical protein
MNELEREKDIQKAAEKLAQDNCYSKIHGKYQHLLHSKYQSERRLQEAVIVKRLVHLEKSKAKAEKDTRYHDDT